VGVSVSTEFLKDLPISEEERQKLASLGAPTPLALLLLRKASPEAFDRHVGGDRAAAIVDALKGLLSKEEKTKLKAPISPKGKFGARLSPPPQKLEPTFDLETREQLFKELESLRRLKETTQRDQRIAELEAELDALVSRR
jgi:hypothetical protein